MALLLIDGFEQYNTHTHLSRGNWVNSTASTLVNFPEGRHGAGTTCLENGFNSGTIKYFFPATDYVVIGFAYEQSIAPLATLFTVQLLDGATVMLSLVVTDAGELELRRGASTQLDITSGLGLATSVWAYIELKVTIHDTTGAYECQVDGASRHHGERVLVRRQDHARPTN
jgi:hypothetical protein